MKTVVITGGPCAGKTSAIDILRKRCERSGIAALFVPEAATDLILDGVAPWTCASMLEFQTRVMELQVKRETEAFEQAARMEGARRSACLAPNGACAEPGEVRAVPVGTREKPSDVLVICDRGICDSHAYLSDEDYARALSANELAGFDARTRYDAVFHLETIAKSNSEAYTKANNRARFENAAEAAAVDARGVAAWSEHPNLRVIPGGDDFNGKIEALVDALREFTGIELGGEAPLSPILVSACLLGEPCRYDAKSMPCDAVRALGRDRELVPVCPEQLGGLPTPRIPSEIQPDGSVVDREGNDRTDVFHSGAQAALRIARKYGCKQAILKAKSPSCGVHEVYDGSFSGTVVPGRGITASLLANAGLEVLDETEIRR